MQSVRNDVERMELVSIHDLVPFQGELKELSNENYLKLKNDLLEYGFSEAFTVWIKPDGAKCLLNGHQRLRTLFRMKDEGFGIPELPIQIVKAKDEEEAHMKVLSLTSSFGRMTEQSVATYITHNKLNVKKVIMNFTFPEIKMNKVQLLLSGNAPELKAETIDLSQQWIVSIHCTDEEDMQKVYEEMNARGYECKLIT